MTSHPSPDAKTLNLANGRRVIRLECGPICRVCETHRAAISWTNPKLEIRNPKQIQISKWRMTKTPGGTQYDLEDQTYEFARYVRAFDNFKGSVWNIRVLNFEFVSNFDIRISNLDKWAIANLFSSFLRGTLETFSLHQQFNRRAISSDRTCRIGNERRRR